MNKFKIDKSKCIGCGMCADICPDGFEIIDGKSRIKNGNAICLKDAAEACPRNAILLDEENSNDKEVNNKFSGKKKIKK
jgi:ferredoxin